MTDRVKLVLGTMTFGESVFDEDALAMVRAYLEAGGDELDTAYVYNEGECERILGRLLPRIGRENVTLDTKVNPRITGKLDAEAACMQLNESLERLGTDHADVFYLHFPDPATPVENVLRACGELHAEGKFRELGLSNFPAWLVADAWHICKENGWVLPTVYEGIYNPLTRLAETELNMALTRFGMRFYAYNPLAGGLLSGRYGKFEDAPEDGRFTHRPNYQKRYWKKSFFEAVDLLKEACEAQGVTLVEAVFRWLLYHSMLQADRGDAVILGASKMTHLKQNLEAAEKGPLPQELLDAFEAAWQHCRADSPAYFTFYKKK
ncbi:MAG: aldo/keto reductase [Lachnospiraceae bacterium]|nr:aldo/keto reductase [Lachnospiraceae bacterium]